MKERKSKLDAHAERLDVWFGEQKLTCKEVQAQLLQDGVQVSESRLAEWWSDRQSQLLQQRMFANIASGSRMNKDVKREFGKNAPPEMQTLIDLHSTMIMQLAVKAQVDPKLLGVVDSLMRTVMDYQSGQTKAAVENRKLDQNDRRIVILEKKAEQADSAKGVLNDKELTEEERALRMRQIFGITS